jgi:hypothetical protein
VTLEGSFHGRTFAKVVGSLVGHVTRAAVGPCVEGAATVLTATLPWHMRYVAFSGNLPSIATLKFDVIGFSMQTNQGGLQTLFRSETFQPVRDVFAREATGELVAGTLAGEIVGSSGSTSIIEPAVATAHTVPGGATRITVTLI